jgi:hypothetical protein
LRLFPVEGNCGRAEVCQISWRPGGQVVYSKPFSIIEMGRAEAQEAAERLLVSVEFLLVRCRKPPKETLLFHLLQPLAHTFRVITLAPKLIP